MSIRLLTLLAVFLPLAGMAQTSIVDPSGTVHEVGSQGWFFWSGFTVACIGMTFAFIKRLARGAHGGHSDF